MNIVFIHIGKNLPDYFITDLTPSHVLFFKLPMGLLTIALTVYPLFVWLLIRWIRRGHTQTGLTA